MHSKDDQDFKQPSHVELLESIQNPRKRRRDFQCECGKSYLSYSALYTHAKVKHGEKITFEQSLYANTNYPKKGNPDFIDNDLIQLLEVQQKQYSLHFLSKYLQTVKSQLKDFSKFTHTKKIKVNNSVFLDKYRKYWQMRSKDQQEYDGVSYVLTIDEAIGYFLTSLEKVLQSTDFSFVQTFIMRIRHQLNEVKCNWRYTETNQANDLPPQLNQIFTHKQQVASNDIFKENPNLACMLLYHFASWLFSESLTTFKIKLNFSQEDQ